MRKFARLYPDLISAQAVRKLPWGHFIEYDPAPPFDVGSPKKANVALVEGLKARLLERFEPA